MAIQALYQFGLKGTNQAVAARHFFFEHGLCHLASLMTAASRALPVTTSPARPVHVHSCDRTRGEQQGHLQALTLLSPKLLWLKIEMGQLWSCKLSSNTAGGSLSSCKSGGHHFSCAPHDRVTSPAPFRSVHMQSCHLIIGAHGEVVSNSTCPCLVDSNQGPAQRHLATSISRGTQRRSPCSDSKPHMLTAARSSLRTDLHTTARVT